MRRATGPRQCFGASFRAAGGAPDAAPRARPPHGSETLAFG